MSYDPTQPEDRVGTVAAQAASGDTILIEPGTYYEHIPLEAKSLTLIGTAGAAQTILDGGRPLEGREGSIIYTREGAGADLVLEGLTLQNGKGARWADEGDMCTGGAVMWWYKEWDLLFSLTIGDCVFRDNFTDHPNALGGGAVFASHLNELRVERCSFFGNETFYHGGVFYVDLVRSTLYEDCYFELNASESGGGVAIWHEGLTGMTIRGCTFESDVSEPPSSNAILAAGPMGLEMVDNRFIDHRAQVATKVTFYQQWEGPRQEFTISRNLFWWAAGPDSAAPSSLVIHAPDGTFTVSGNTFVRCGFAGYSFPDAPPSVIERNIFARAELTLYAGGGSSVRCNDFWKADISELGTSVLSDNIFDAPLFCNELAGDLTIASNSPCAAEHSPSGCGRIGALDPACTGQAVRQMTWGRIKGLFR